MQIVRCKGAITPAALEELLDMVPFPRRALYAPDDRIADVKDALLMSVYAGSAAVVGVFPSQTDGMVVCVSLDDILSNPRALALMMLTDGGA